jgi:hypothetical protein
MDADLSDSREPRPDLAAMLAVTRSRCERLIVSHHYADGMSLNSIAATLFLSEPRVRLIHDEVRSRLRPPDQGGHSTGSPVPGPTPGPSPGPLSVARTAAGVSRGCKTTQRKQAGR